MNPFNKIERAYSKLFKNYRSEGLIPWKTNPKPDMPYQIGVTLSWPGSDEVIKRESISIKEMAQKVAEKYNLESLVSQPTLAAGGALVMYVGLKQFLCPLNDISSNHA
jgi:hypothetical protein